MNWPNEVQLDVGCADNITTPDRREVANSTSICKLAWYLYLTYLHLAIAIWEERETPQRLRRLQNDQPSPRTVSFQVFKEIPSLFSWFVENIIVRFGLKEYWISAVLLYLNVKD
jgi:hypothetical protein